MAISSSMRWRRSKPVMTLSLTVARMPSASWNCGAAAGAVGGACSAAGHGRSGQEGGDRHARQVTLKTHCQSWFLKRRRRIASGSRNLRATEIARRSTPVAPSISCTAESGER
jgi:hypothetical protein